MSGHGSQESTSAFLWSGHVLGQGLLQPSRREYSGVCFPTASHQETREISLREDGPKQFRLCSLVGVLKTPKGFSFV